MAKEILKCKHGVFKVTCVQCCEYDDKKVIKEAKDALEKDKWISNSFSDNSAHNSHSDEQDYDIDQDTLKVADKAE